MKKNAIFFALMVLGLSFTGNRVAHGNTEFLVIGTNIDFPMSDKEPRIKDYYMNIGSDQGIKVGSKLKVIRKIKAINQLKENESQVFTFPIGILTVISVENNRSIGRVLKNKPLPLARAISSRHKNIIAGDKVEIMEK